MNKETLFPALDRKFLSQTESLILNGKAFRLSRDYPAYLNKLRLAGIKYIVVNSKSISYTDTLPSADIRPGAIMDVDEELKSLPGDFLKMAEPDMKVIRSVTGGAMYAQGINISGLGSRISEKSLLKAERLF